MTAGFVFTDSNGQLYVGTGGDGGGVAVGDAVTTGGIGRFGSIRFVVSAVFADENFALVQVDADKVGLVTPSLCTWGGPTGVVPPGMNLGLLQELRFHTNLDPVGECVLAQLCAGRATHSNGASFGMLGPTGVFRGGIPVQTTTGAAVGFLTVLHLDGDLAGPRIGQALELVRQGTGLELAVVAAPMAS